MKVNQKFTSFCGKHSPKWAWQHKSIALQVHDKVLKIAQEKTRQHHARKQKFRGENYEDFTCQFGYRIDSCIRFSRNGMR